MGAKCRLLAPQHTKCRLVSRMFWLEGDLLVVGVLCDEVP